ncbi:MAG: YaiO family outer membrane beta-barrel protein [Gammaproteobacteria bacterium]
MMLDLPASAQEPAAPSAGSYDQQYQRARDFAAAGQLDLAIATYTTLLARSPNNADVLLGRGQAYARLNRYDEAERDLRAAAEVAPTYADVYAALAQVYMWSERPALAIPVYSKLIELQPTEPAHRSARARAYQASGQPELAKADLQAASERSAPADADKPAAPPARIADTNPEVESKGYDWALGASATATRLSQRDQRWNEQNLSLRRYFTGGSLAVETLRASRFGQHGHAWALDGYARLWSGAYTNLRYQKAPAERLFPGTSWRAELYQSVGGGWELAASDDRLNFGDSRVDIYGVAVARYFGNFYVRLRHTNIVSAGSHSSGDRLVGRYYYRGNGDDYVELAASRGRIEDPLALSSGRLRSGGVSVAFVNYVTPLWGYKVGASHADDDSSGSERAVTLSLVRRW